ncbi:MAG: hypothetical protein HKN14_14495, partial [Marinicaulis sp.]|nr:hypothetical protein [Marinicaulis sp.]
DPYERNKSDEAFTAELEERYKRLSLLTLDLAEDAGEAARNMADADKGDKPTWFDRRISAANPLRGARRS